MGDVMMGPSHRVAGVVAWLAASPQLGTHGSIAYTLAGTVFAGATANGRLSPDADRYPWLTKIIPGGHRGILHWWLPTVIVLWHAIHMTGPYQWQVAAVSIGWASHIATDGIFGRIPIWPRIFKRSKSRWRYAGLSLSTGGKIERWVAVPAFILVGLWLVLSSLGLRSSW